VSAEGEASFSSHIRDLRQRLGRKQLWLAVVVGCTDAAVSYWESGKRIPNAQTISRIVDALTREGASGTELARLRRSWLKEKNAQRATQLRRGKRTATLATAASS
jgi:transcriptional regulator with XRE-family HTH domain